MYDDGDEQLQEEVIEPQKTEKQRNDENNAKNVRNAADVAIASKNPYAVAAGSAVKIADKFSGGKASESIGKGISRVNKHAPLGRIVQKNSNRLAESGASDKIGKVAAMKNGAKGNSTGTSNKSIGNIASSANKTNNVDNNQEGKAKFVKILKKPTTRKIIIFLLPIILIVLLFVYIAAILEDDSSSGGGMAMGGYYSTPCPEVTVIFTDKTKGYEVTGSGTYSLEEYVAGVIAGEVGFLGSIEVDKTFAIAARSFFSVNNNDCTIESSDKRQVFRELTDSSTDKMAMQAAEETKGQVLLFDGKVYGTQYDAFACIAEDDNYYTISQANQKIPKQWIDARINRNNSYLADWFICNGKENLRHHHGNGLSQYGSLYLATEQNYTYDQILHFYLGDEYTISTNSLSASVANLDIKVTKNASYSLNMPIEEFLNSKGGSLADYNSYIKNSVTEVGPGTREGVVTAAVAVINYLYDNYDAKLPYYWNGKENAMGLTSKFGKTLLSVSPGGNNYYYQSFDCSGFVSWAIRNGGYNFSGLGSGDFYNKFSNNSCNVTDSSCVGKPGDLIWCEGHIQLIVETNEESGQYIIADSTDLGVTMRQQGINQIINNKTTKVLFLDDYYSDISNVNLNY